MPISSTPRAVEASSSPSTLRCPPSGAASTSPTLRRLRAAWALLSQETTRAGNQFLPSEEREHALREAHRHLDTAWQTLTSLVLEQGSSETATKAAEMLGEANRRLPLIAASLRGPASFGKDVAA